jgi:multiple sugar transport system permease protein
VLVAIARYTAIAVVLAVFLAPFLWMVLASLRRHVDITGGDLFGADFTGENYRTVFQVFQFGDYIVNSLVIAFWSTLLSLLIGLPAAYAIARGNLRRTALTILVARMVPGIGLVTPWYIIFNYAGLTGTYTSMVLCHMLVSLPFVVWVMMNFFQGLPVEFEDAALIDGAGPIGAFVRIVLPLAAPGIVTSGIMAFIFSWNNFLFSLVLSSKSTKPLPVAMYSFIGYSEVDWGGLMAAAVSVTMPVLLFALFVQRYIVAGLTAGAVKG